jgi:DNA-binding transcriptional LysR family regulator
MELRHFYSFVAVAEELSFTKAAKRLQIAQPPVSRHIQDLESELGIRLLERKRAKVSLTDAGRSFLNEARAVLQHVSQAVEAAQQVSKGWAGAVRLGIAKGLGDIVSRVLNEYLRIASKVEIDVLDIPSGFQAAALVERRIDVGFLRPPIGATQLVSARLFQEPFEVVLRKASPLAKRKSLRVRDLKDETLLLIDRSISPGVYDQTLALFRQHSIEPKTIPTSNIASDQAGSILVDSGKGIFIAVGTSPMHPAFSDRLIALPLKDSSAFTDVHVAWRKGEQSKTTLDFVRFTRDAFHVKKGMMWNGKLARAVKPRPKYR